MSNPTSIQVEFVTGKEAYAGWGLHIDPSPTAFIVTGFIEGGKERVDRMAVVTQHFNMTREWGSNTETPRRTPGWDVDFIHDGDPQEQMVCESLGEAMACAKAYCCGPTP